MVYQFFGKKSSSLADKSVSCSGVTTLANKIEQNQYPLDLAKQQIAEELHKSIIKIFKNITLFHI